MPKFDNSFYFLLFLSPTPPPHHNTKSSFKYSNNNLFKEVFKLPKGLSHLQTKPAVSNMINLPQLYNTLTGRRQPFCFCPYLVGPLLRYPVALLIE